MEKHTILICNPATGAVADTRAMFKADTLHNWARMVIMILLWMFVLTKVPYLLWMTSFNSLRETYNLLSVYWQLVMKNIWFVCRLNFKVCNGLVCEAHLSNRAACPSACSIPLRVESQCPLSTISSFLSLSLQFKHLIFWCIYQTNSKDVCYLCVQVRSFPNPSSVNYVTYHSHEQMCTLCYV